MYMPIEEGVRTYLIVGFSIVICTAILYTLYLWIKYKKKSYIWIMLHFLTLGYGMVIFINLLTGNFMDGVMVSEDNSLKVAGSGFLWALSIFFFLKGLTNLSRSS
ncbi:hypothetical protein BACCIP111899_04408 [Bacillus rhizoplanae]|uniref:Uncharacterized protein n=1 Tax=Bacillus rhizoplanae TaxID=2880966 RepID=A0ABM8YH59_9BACI|nr:hypothetical protein [Bacillus rhizoplanae]CAG9615171.1 hypothetical protein BACCIP111899_04408 [Bacillus rhizoplanae]